jgi:hypothetical protein
MCRTISLVSLAFALVAAPAFAVTASTDPEGFVRHSVQPGRQTIGLTLNNPVLVAGAVLAAESRFALLDPATASALVGLDPSAAHYAEIVGRSGSPLSGDRLEIDVAATVESAQDGLVVFKDSIHNTLTLPLASEALAGYRLIVRRHLTIASVFGSGDTASLGSGFRFEDADALLFYDRLSGGYGTQYLCRTEHGSSEWRKLGSVGRADDMIIAPGTGLFLERRSAEPLVVTVHGVVRTNDFAMPLAAGFNFIASPFPLPANPTTLQMDVENGFVAGARADEADQVFFFATSDIGSAYFHRDATNHTAEWLDIEEASTAAASVGAATMDCVFVKKIASDPHFLVRNTLAL